MMRCTSAAVQSCVVMYLVKMAAGSGRFNLDCSRAWWGMSTVRSSTVSTHVNMEACANDSCARLPSSPLPRELARVRWPGDAERSLTAPPRESHRWTRLVLLLLLLPLLLLLLLLLRLERALPPRASRVVPCVAPDHSLPRACACGSTTSFAAADDAPPLMAAARRSNVFTNRTAMPATRIDDPPLSSFPVPLTRPPPPPPATCPFLIAPCGTTTRVPGSVAESPDFAFQRPVELTRWASRCWWRGGHGECWPDVDTDTGVGSPVAPLPVASGSPSRVSACTPPQYRGGVRLVVASRGDRGAGWGGEGSTEVAPPSASCCWSEIGCGVARTTRRGDSNSCGGAAAGRCTDSVWCVDRELSLSASTRAFPSLPLPDTSCSGLHGRGGCANLLDTACLDRTSRSGFGAVQVL